MTQKSAMSKYGISTDDFTEELLQHVISKLSDTNFKLTEEEYVVLKKNAQKQYWNSHQKKKIIIVIPSKERELLVTRLQLFDTRSS